MIFVSAHVMAMLITALDMFTNFCLVPLLLLAGSLVPKFTFSERKKLYREVRADEQTLYKLADSVTDFAQLRVLYSDKTRSSNQW